ncbi:MAG TPA: S53 family peptidase [Rugosimonospora sp.]|nr:S53 family peptidase [Rugosimonospora sp.]
MRHTRRLVSIAVAATAAIVGLALATPAHAVTLIAAARATDGHGHMRSCVAVAHAASCSALVRMPVVTGAASPNAATPSGLFPADLVSAYNLPSSTAGSGQTIAIVDAYNAPTAEADLAVYRSQFGLPACTTANGCFKKVNQSGGTTYPSNNGGWAEEISLDLDMASAICPNCKILLVEATSASFANLGAAENRAATLGANVISNSYGGSDASDSTYGTYYNHPGIAITVSSGDGGYGVEYPASSHYVTAVGGTSLTKSSSTTRGWTETAWSGAGSGCSAYNTALSGASSFGTGCSRRAVADVSAVADPNTGVAVYDSYAYQGLSGWLVFGGTSVSSPIIAGVYALAGNTASIDNNYPYTHSTSLNDVTSGSNGSCSTSQWCTARTGWDGPTGLGTPNGSGAF